MIATLQSYYKATENPEMHFLGWTEHEFRSWMILGRKNKGYREAMEDLWLSLCERNHRFENIVIDELKKI